MAQIPAFCQHCNFLFPSRVFNLKNVRLHLEGNRETCPNCGKMAAIIDGTFNVTNDALEMLSGSSLSREMLRAFAGLVEKAVTKEISTEDLEKQAAELNPQFGELLHRLKSPSLTIALVLVIIWLKACHYNLDAKVDLNQLFDQVTGHRPAATQTLPKGNVQDSHTDKPGSDAKTTSDSSDPKGPSRVH